MLLGQIQPPHREEGENNGDRQSDDRDQRRTDVPQKNDADERDDDALLDQLFAKRADRAFDQVAAVVSRYDPHAFGQRRLDLLDLLFDSVDDVERVLAVTHNDDAADRFAVSVELSHAAPDVASEVNVARRSSCKPACRSRP